MRNDKNRANAFIGAEGIYTQIMHPITQQDLIQPGDVYFQKKDDGEYKHMRKYMNAVK